MHGAECIARSWYSMPERTALLIMRAEHWVGTPFFPNSQMAGPKGGVSCQKLASALYEESGFGRIEVPEVAMSHARFSRVSLMEAWMDGRPDFQALLGLSHRGAGDLLGFRIHKTIHHMGVLLANGVFIHALDGVGTAYNELSDPTWGGRLGAIWRPLWRAPKEI